MLNVFVFDSLLLLCCGYALWRGGAPERIGGIIFLLATALTVVAASGPASRFASVEMGIFIVDVATLVALIVLALRAERHWPLWVAGLQIVGTAGHAVKLVDPTVIPRAYAFALAFWSYPMLLILVLGTWRHQQRLAKFGADRSWSSSWGRSGRQRGGGPTG
ncbi:MAG TPA: hypothetical protein VK614_14935 [Allosphingosinicella sp.]|nr:hypothetical protein [Allosphingosinicella sp.]